jgi:hypothetical protein
VEDVIGLIVDAMAKRARGGAPARRPTPPGTPKPPPRPTTAAPIRVVLPAQPSQPPAPRPAPAAVRPPPADPFAAAPTAPHPSPTGASLLSAFTSRERLLAAIVLSEALGAPVALRNDNSLRSRDVLGPDAEN